MVAAVAAAAAAVTAATAAVATAVAAAAAASKQKAGGTREMLFLDFLPLFCLLVVLAILGFQCKTEQCLLVLVQAPFHLLLHTIHSTLILRFANLVEVAAFQSLACLSVR